MILRTEILCDYFLEEPAVLNVKMRMKSLVAPQYKVEFMPCWCIIGPEGARVANMSANAGFQISNNKYCAQLQTLIFCIFTFILVKVKKMFIIGATLILNRRKKVCFHFPVFLRACV